MMKFKINYLLHDLRGYRSRLRRSVIRYFLHQTSHLNGRARCFCATIMLFPEAANARVVFFLENEDCVDDGEPVLDLNLGEGVSHPPADVLGMTGLALEDDAETDDRIVRSVERGAWSVGHRAG